MSDTVFGSLPPDVWRLLFTDFACVIEARLFLWVSQQCRDLTSAYFKEVPKFQEALCDPHFFESDKNLAVWYGRCGRDQNIEPFSRLCSKIFAGKKERRQQRKQWVELTGIFRGAVMAWNEALLYPLPIWRQVSRHSVKALNMMNLNAARRHELTKEKNPNGGFVFLGAALTLHVYAIVEALSTCPTAGHLQILLHLLDRENIPDLIGKLLHRDAHFWAGVLVTIPAIATQLEKQLLFKGAANSYGFDRLVRESQCSHLLPLMTQYFLQLPGFLEDERRHRTLLLFFGIDAHTILFGTREHVDAFFTALALARIPQRPEVYMKHMSLYPEKVVEYFMEHLQMPENLALHFNLDLLFRDWKKADIRSVRWLTFFAKLAAAGNLHLHCICGISSQFFGNIPDRLVPEYAAAMDRIHLPEFAMNFAGFGQVLTFLTKCPHHMAYLYTLYKRDVVIRWTIGSNIGGKSYSMEVNSYFWEHDPHHVEAMKKEFRHMADRYNEIILDPFVSF
jgi:hypothetical protein